MPHYKHTDAKLTLSIFLDFFWKGNNSSLIAGNDSLSGNLDTSA